MENTTLKTIVKRVMAALNIGEEGNVGSFFLQLVKATNRDMVNIKSDMAAAELEYKQELESLADDLTDAKQELEQTYENVEVAKIKTIADQKAYISTYLSRVTSAKARVKLIEDRIKYLKESHADYVKSEKARIAELEERLTVFNAE